MERAESYTATRPNGEVLLVRHCLDCGVLTYEPVAPKLDDELA